MSYSPSNFPHRVDGKAAIYRHNQGLPNAYSRRVFPNTLYPTIDPNWLFALRIEEKSTLPRRVRPITTVNLFHLRDTQIVLSQEYFNFLILDEAFGDRTSLESTFNLSK